MVAIEGNSDMARTANSAELDPNQTSATVLSDPLLRLYGAQMYWALCIPRQRAAPRAKSIFAPIWRAIPYGP